MVHGRVWHSGGEYTQGHWNLILGMQRRHWVFVTEHIILFKKLIEGCELTGCKADILFPESCFVVHIDGVTHSTEHRRREDALIDKLLALNGYRSIRIPDSELWSKIGVERWLDKLEKIVGYIPRIITVDIVPNPNARCPANGDTRQIR
jgi:very-short-patch-repair endonuclease